MTMMGLGAGPAQLLWMNSQESKGHRGSWAAPGLLQDWALLAPCVGMVVPATVLTMGGAANTQHSLAKLIHLHTAPGCFLPVARGT